ncbi:MAG: prolipoprotein diacylglyceryl transferase [Bacilli bacterium]|jgi:phosphatidylglycerol:prolipoprotein diacylglycerol transferase|nr:prolipoprotein diacylglyceryl transferase [Bacilli bacterium]
MAIAALVIGLVLLLGGTVYLIRTQKKFAKSARPSLLRRDKAVFAVCAAAISAGALLTQLSINLFNPSWKTNADYSYPLYASMAYIGAFFLALSNVLLWLSFYLYYYKPKMEPKQRKLCRILMFVGIPLVFVFFLLWTQGCAPYIAYPLVSGFTISSTGFKWVRGTYSGGDFHVAFYAFTMLFGVLVCYWVGDHRFYKEFHKHGILDNVAIFAFLCGVLGARVWYVIGNWTRDGFDRNPASIFAIWNGGLTIMGGALGGVIGGVIFMMLRRKYVNIRWAMDVIVPTILLAQCIGRWGNFLNQEVYGGVVNVADGWAWLPLFIQKNMQMGLPDGQIHVPLFLIEGTINLAGYFLIAWGIGKTFKRYLAKGDLAGCYFMWYGIIRMILEPFRDSAYNMGADNEWSIWSSLVYVILGAGFIVFNHLLDFKEKRAAASGSVPFFVAAASCLAVALFTPFLTGIKGTGYRTSLGVITESESQSYMGMNLIFGGNGWNANAGLIIAYLFVAAALAYAVFSFLQARKNPEAPGYRNYLISAGLGGVGVILFVLSKAFLGLRDGTGDFGSLTGVTISYNYGPGFLLTIVLTVLAVGFLFIPYLDHRLKKKTSVAEIPFEG